MTTLMAELTRKARRLTADERERLASELMAEAEAEPLTEVEEAWVAEAEARYDAWKAGRSQVVEAGDAVAAIRRELRP